MKSSRNWAVLPLALLLAACGGDAEDAQIDVAETTPDAPMATEQPQMTPAAPMGMAMQAQTAQLQPVRDSNVSGEVTVNARDQQTEVMVRLTGGTANGSHPGHIHTGTCDAIGGVVQPLEPIATDATGAGTATSTVSVAPMTAMDGQHIVVYHGEGGAPVTCAQIPGHAM